MDNNISPSAHEHNILEDIQKGMKVYDTENRHVGKVEGVYMGEVAPRQEDLGKGPATAPDRDSTERSSLVEDFARTLNVDDEVPEVLKERLRREGYIYVDSAGLFDHNLYALRSQISGISDDQVRLNVRKNELIERE